MQYLLVENQTTVLFGPSFWKPRLIQSILDDETTVDCIVPPAEPNSYLLLGSDTDGNVYEIFPVDLEIPAYDPIFQELSGPAWDYSNNIATGSYVVIDRAVHAIQTDLIRLAAQQRYIQEIAGTTVTLQSEEVSVATDRDTRNLYIQKFSTMTNIETVLWKFPKTWLTLTYSDMELLIKTVNDYVQSKFVWEQEIVNQIAMSTTVAELREITIVAAPTTPAIGA